MKAGLSQGPVVIKEYVDSKAENGIYVSVQECGFFVSPTHAFLGASRDHQDYWNWSTFKQMTQKALERYC